MDLRFLEAQEEDFDIAHFKRRECQTLHDTIVIHELPSNYRVLDFSSLSKCRLKIVEDFRQFGLHGWARHHGKICMDLVKKFYANVTTEVSELQKPLLRSFIGGRDY